jgi:hypothetical protein
MLGPDGRIGHVEVEVGEAVIMLFDAGADWPVPPALARAVDHPLSGRRRRAAAGAARQSSRFGLLAGATQHQCRPAHHAYQIAVLIVAPVLNAHDAGVRA